MILAEGNSSGRANKGVLKYLSVRSQRRVTIRDFGPIFLATSSEPTRFAPEYVPTGRPNSLDRRRAICIAFALGTLITSSWATPG